ncbi:MULTISPECIES: NAD(P)-dependent oxidoreductase [Bacillus amyloliquefaciens group]|uniref:NAD(P)-dependent oxidoreductase n=1 Tax=Bacillus amyloliquefaciens group TaxID=1938374 RepID=UPI0013628EB8|nr:MULTISPECIES: NAD(P)-dependent oxidoreductase [Bacillus amyloliquefaciens group]MBO3650101.1 NAD(P)-dependent oxidoreductase [Bacillus amyloliquefaciens]MBW7976301.1 NAD(P)-dependent oxidoreductase [Bacillus velezensis]MCJ2174579.1 NAD(P)-dependent oxidoreductase [Bacillus amyloliquefaciens]MCR4348392.1 NAD(P)-dependent oxidoreductase [Bacillus amyloliquefaciens]MCR4357033.1 NAD(P)-dependent oxidoreductase [Bacillus amyloliquefaciens]
MNKTVGFIGLGVMGNSMATHILEAGYPVLVYTRTKQKAEEILNKGAVWQETVKDLSEKADIIITMVGYPSDVEDIYLGENGILRHAKEGTFVIDMTTSKPSLAKKIAEQAKEKSIHALDAPVSGGDIGARNGTLAIMAGGEKEAFEACLPLFSVMGENIQYQGPAGSGQHTKMCNQIAIAAGMVGVAEAMAYAEKSGLNPEQVLKSITTGAAGSWSLSNLAPRMLKGDFAPGFYVKHFIKDMGIALEEAELMGEEMPGLALAKSLYDKLSAQGEENSGTQSIYKLWVK